MRAQGPGHEAGARIGGRSVQGPPYRSAGCSRSCRRRSMASSYPCAAAASYQRSAASLSTGASIMACMNWAPGLPRCASASKARWAMASWRGDSP
ncbi:hypothetical protein G6F64_015355 [Rhizopus arrhizus]|uniref:Uncharacterized protein n=1 Tax=Rhizopus oryzae TaxID=64495 RepID=A0A9P6WRN9_RHIOR|nr:hypothetical protein G6F64_015355 [Rhizopus arrhizus]